VYAQLVLVADHLLKQQGIGLFPIVQWAERGGYQAGGHGNSVPRFHITWGTGPGVLLPFVRRVMEHVRTGRITLLFRHRVTQLTTFGRRVTGVAGEILEPSSAGRGASSSRTVVGDFMLSAGSVIVTSGGIGGNRKAQRHHGGRGQRNFHDR